ncbi:Nucleolar complex protein 3 [Kappamyces sp. JEL0680]|nr:Nucleolar complex protein 3 [Kappamyces sp. JEL0680]
MPKAKKTLYKVSVPAYEAESDGEHFEDEDLDLLNEYGSRLGFLSKLDFQTSAPQSKMSRKKPKETDDPDTDSEAEADYERIPRVTVVEETRLPVKNEKGQIVENAPKNMKDIVAEKKAAKSAAKQDSVKDDAAPLEPPSSNPAPKPSAPQPAKEKSRRIPVNEIKETLASVASLILEDPEKHVAELKSIQKFARDPRDQIVQLALLTQLAIYKDIIPGYRIRKLSDGELATQVSKDVRRLRNFEEVLLSNYQAYLQSLETVLKQKHDNPPLVHLALVCLCQLFTSVTHFNYRVNIMTLIVKYMGRKDSIETTKMCCKAAETVFREDETGEVSLEMVKIMSDHIHSHKYVVSPLMIDTFQHLRLQSELSTGADKGRGTDKNQKRKAGDAAHVTKKQRKINRHLKQAMTEMQEAEATYDKAAKQKAQSETLKFVFLTYFRILKNAPTSLLVPCVLEGLARFARLINVDFFQDLLNVLKTISISQHEMYIEGKDGDYSSALSALHCIIAAFELLDSVGGALSIDLRDFYTALYTQVSRLAFRPGAFDRMDADGELAKRNEIELLLGGLDSMLKKNREIPIERIASFVKRVASLSLSTPGNCAISCLFFTKRALSKFPRLECLLDEEGRVATGIYDPYLDDPNLCNPFATSLWELYPLMIHYNPAVAGLARDMCKARNDFTGTNLNIATVLKSGSRAMKSFSMFQENGFGLYPRVEIPTNITAMAKRFQSSGRIDGPCASYESLFYQMSREPTPWYKVLGLILSWYLTSISLHLYNKWLFSKDHNDFHFPLFTTMIHMVIQGSLSYASLIYLFPSLRPKKAPSREDYFWRVVPCGIATGLDIGLSNSSLKYITLSFYTMVKSAAPVFVLLFAFVFGLERVSLALTGAITIICLGVGIMVMSETKFDATGYIEAQLATILSGFRWALTQVLLQSASMGMDNPLATNMFLAPIVAGSLFFAFVGNEGFSALVAAPQLSNIGDAAFLLTCITGGGVIAFLMVNIEFALISSTSVVTFSVAGIFKEIITILAAIAVFGDKFTGNMVLGLTISLVGIAGYNYLRITQKQSEMQELYEELNLSDFGSDGEILLDEAEVAFDEQELDELAFVHESR